MRPACWPQQQLGWECGLAAWYLVLCILPASKGRAGRQVGRILSGSSAPVCSCSTTARVLTSFKRYATRDVLAWCPLCDCHSTCPGCPPGRAAITCAGSQSTPSQLLVFGS